MHRRVEEFVGVYGDHIDVHGDDTGIVELWMILRPLSEFHLSFGEKVRLMCPEVQAENMWFRDSFQSLGLFQGLSPKPYIPQGLGF